jgi:hypothetical protein
MSDPEDQPELDFASDIGFALWRENLSRGKRSSTLKTAVRSARACVGLSLTVRLGYFVRCSSH